jgi:two-component system nitrate/nitrite response regulator NarL
MASEHEATASTTEALRVLIIDPHAAFRWASRALLQTEGVDIVADLENCDGVCEAVARLRPDVVLIDVSPLALDGLTVARRVAGLVKSPAVVLMSGARPDAVLAAAAGATAFVPKAEITAEAVARAAAHATADAPQPKEL